jgi:ABC-type branched-subunit amino acid transport system substrate-binding protein
MKLAATLMALLIATPALAAEPVRIGVTTILSGAMADRGQSEQYGIELALQRINEAGGVLGRPVEAFYGDNAANPEMGVKAVHHLIDDDHVPVIIGALATPVTHAIMPVVQEAKVPLVIDISAGQDFVDASGAGGNPYVFKIIPSDLDIGRAMAGWLQQQGVHSVAIVADDNAFNKANAASFAKAMADVNIQVTSNETVPAGTTDLGPILARLLDAKPDRIVPILGPSTAAFFKAYEQARAPVPLAGRIDFGAAMAAVSPDFLRNGGLKDVDGIVVFTPLLDMPGVQDFVAGYRAKYGITPTQRSFFAYEAAYLVVDAIKQAGADTPAAITEALRNTAMPCLLGGSFVMDDHNHPHTPMQILSVRDGKVAVIGRAG